jgi:hypothetical protein
MIMMWPGKIISEMRTSAYYDAKGAITCHNLVVQAESGIDDLFMPVVLLPHTIGDSIYVRCQKIPSGLCCYDINVRGAFGDDSILFRAFMDGGRSFEVTRSNSKGFKSIWRV